MAWIERRTVNHEVVDRAHEVVRAFITERRRIIYGGLAIDFAMRLRGDALYKDGRAPDYDVYSPDNVGDAYDLVDIFVEKRFHDVGCTRAIHVVTMRVKVAHTWVIDITYVPPEIFAKLPTLVYEQMQVLHPDYQRMDMHLAFCFPFNNAPFEDIFHRWQKDADRFALLETIYPVCSDASEAPESLRVEVPPDLVRPGGPAALHGAAALAVYKQVLSDMTNRHTNAASDVLRVATTRGATVQLAAQDVGAVAAALGAKHADLYHPYMDAQGPLAVFAELGDVSTRVEVTLTAHPETGMARQLAVAHAKYDGMDVQVVTPHFVLLWLLYRHYTGHEDALGQYCWLLGAMREAGTLLAELVDADTDEGAAAIAACPLIAPITPLGARNVSEAQLVRLAPAVAAVGAPPDGRYPADLPNILSAVPPSYHQGRARPRPFDYAASQLFRLDGSLDKKLVFGA